VDAEGREVLLRGVNVNQLGDYYQDHPSIPSTVSLTEEDFARIAALGMNVVRLIVHWSHLEPTPIGGVSEAYVQAIHQAVDWAKKYGLYVVLDMHQDAWGKHIATPPEETCLPAFERAIGWDGAPEWATFTDGLPTCRLFLRELSPAVAQAFQSFWIDRGGIQEHLVEVWARLAREFAAEPAVAGYDFLNEPHPGWTVGGSEVSFLGLFYRRVLDAIRASENGVPGGFPHIGFFEPMNYWSAVSAGLSPVPFTLDENVVYAPHLYAGSITADRAVGLDLISIARGFEQAEIEARRYGTTFWSGEWGWFGNDGAQVSNDELDRVKEYARQEDAHLVGGAWWQWKQSCGDPHTIGTPGRDPKPPETPTSGNLVVLGCPANDDLGLVPQFAKVLSRAYPHAAPGRLLELRSDSDQGTLDLSGTHDGSGSGMLDVWAPGGTAPQACGGGTGPVAITPVAGGFRLRTAVAAGEYELRLGPAACPD